MRPITDKHKVSRARLAYNVDCTAAPICIIAPISSWAAAVASYVPPEVQADGYALFLQAKEELQDIDIVITHSDIVEDWFINQEKNL